MNNCSPIGEECSEFVEVDPTGRYGRYKEILGKGASKIVYRAYDEYQGIEVAWNQVKLYDFFHSPEDLERLYCEIHLLKTLNHNNIMKYYTSWVDTAKRNINFVTEMFSSGTLKQYRERHKRANIRAIKSWCRQILKGLLYLHSLDPPVIHRDLKCDNIFVNGNQGEVKIGDLGLAAILRKSHVAHCVGTPEFMAPEVYAEEYDELVDIYSFGMCILEMVTFEYPYSECTHPAQIYKKVISGIKPDALCKVKDPEIRLFIDKCLATVSLRLSARELLNDPFLKIDNEFDSQSMGSWRGDDRLLLPREPYIELDRVSYLYYNGSFNENLNGEDFGANVGEWECDSTKIENCGIELFECAGDEREEMLTNFGVTMKGKRREDGSIFLRLRISDDEECVRNIHFPFDVENDTALSVATEMVAELDLTDHDVTKIAEMMDTEIISLVPTWKPGPGFVETPRCSTSNTCENYEFPKELKILRRTRNNSVSMHGRFEEIIYQSPQKSVSENVNKPILSNGIIPTEIWDMQESLECSTRGSGESYSEEEIEKVDGNKIIPTKGKIEGKEMDKNTSSFRRVLVKSFSDLSVKAVSCFAPDFSEEHEKEIQKEMRWVRAKYQMEIRDKTDQQLRLVQNSPIQKRVINGISPFTLSTPFQGEIIVKSFSNSRKTKSSEKKGVVRGSFAYKLC